MKTVVIVGAALRQWTKLAPDVRKRLRAKLDIYAATGAGDVKAPKGREGARLRVGDWRIVIIEDNTDVAVVDVGHRRDVYNRAGIMMPVQFIKLENGDELAILPRRDYERLVETERENEEDARTVVQARAALAAGEDILIPLSVADTIADGGNAVRTLRKWRGMTQVELAAAAGLTQGYLSDMENGRRRGTAATLNAIAQALRVPLALLVD